MSTNPQDISALIARVEDVLEPFAKVADFCEFAWVEHEDEDDVIHTLTVGDFRRASALLKALHSQTEGGDDAAK